MTIRTKFTGATALTMTLAATPALADLSVDDAWTMWQAPLQAFGLTLAAEPTRKDNALDVGALQVDAALPLGFGKVSIETEGPKFEALGDGTVGVTLPEAADISVNVNFPPIFPDPINLTFGWALENSRYVMSGDLGDVLTTWTADELRLTFDDTQEGLPEAFEGELAFNLTNIDRQNAVKLTGDHLTITGAETYSAFGYRIDMTVGPEDAVTHMIQEGVQEDLTFEWDSTLPRFGADLLALLP